MCMTLISKYKVQIFINVSLMETFVLRTDLFRKRLRNWKLIVYHVGKSNVKIAGRKKGYFSNTGNELESLIDLELFSGINQSFGYTSIVSFSVFIAIRD